VPHGQRKIRHAVVKFQALGSGLTIVSQVAIVSTAAPPSQ
jgi:hypothetical protein